MLSADHVRYRKPKPAFGRWLLAQASGSGAIAELAQAAAGDRQFPKDGDVQAVSKRLNQLQADGDMHLALEEAELDWLCV
ncbi:hypothetical protein QH494_06050 [Sphingomonas sp. AR_OL41]|uniref:hypothetical protein n=1 Tax=Sphingomonas sp. AR_OL41 TaxID=3042729 RepID=UPI0024806B91|nr:hypothetical protein [Sphingomonas sp. AR_OL41]MDH7971740.1 hypothetical protein [Sphingomonas sp. AR_OL41]